MEPEVTKLCTTVILGLIGFGISVYYSKRTQKIANEKMMKELFTEFNKRYDEINKSLVEIEKEYPTSDALDKAKSADNPKYGNFLRQKVIDYFSLCAEEFYWYHYKKRIDRLIWKSWQSGMNYWYKKVPVVKYLWELEVKANGKESYHIDIKQKKIVGQLEGISQNLIIQLFKEQEMEKGMLKLHTLKYH